MGASQTTHDFAVNLSKQDKYLLYKNLPFCVVINSREYFFSLIFREIGRKGVGEEEREKSQCDSDIMVGCHA